MIFRRSLLVPVIALAVAPLAFGQEPAPSGEVLTPPPVPAAPRLAPRSAPGAPLPQDSRLPAPSPSPETPLMPDQTPSLVKPDATPDEPAKKATKTSKTEAFEQDQTQKIRFRQVNTQALADPAVMAQWEKSNHVRKDADKRTILKEYYKLLYARMMKIDPSLKTQIDLQAVAADHRLTQTRVTPTEASTDAGERSTAARVFAD